MTALVVTIDSECCMPLALAGIMGGGGGGGGGWS